MKTVGLRELKNRLSEFVRHVRAGEGLLVTDRGEVVAELTPPGQGIGDGSVPFGLRDLARRGIVTLGAPPTADLYPPLRRTRRRHASADLLDEARGPR